MKFSDAKRKHISCVYCLTMPNGMSYIGKTSDLGSRLGLYERAYNGSLGKGGGKINEAIREFGIENVDVEVLSSVTCADKTDLELCLSIIEIRHIRERNTLYPNGYNVSLGGEVLGIPIEHLTTDKDVIRCFKTNDKVILEYDLEGNFLKEYASLARYCYERGLDDNMVRDCLNKRKSVYGKYLIREKRYDFVPEKIEVGEYEIRERVKYRDIVETRTIVKQRELVDSKKAVIAYDLNGDFVGEYESIADSCRRLFNGRTSIRIGVYCQGYILFLKDGDDYPKKIESSDVLGGKQLSEHYRPAVELEDKPKLDMYLVDLAKKHTKLNLDFPINQFKLNGEFVAQYKSIRDASVDTGIRYSLIYNCVMGMTKKSKGYIWRKAEQKEG